MVFSRKYKACSDTGTSPKFDLSATAYGLWVYQVFSQGSYRNSTNRINNYESCHLDEIKLQCRISSVIRGLRRSGNWTDVSWKTRGHFYATWFILLKIVLNFWLLLSSYLSIQASNAYSHYTQFHDHGSHETWFDAILECQRGRSTSNNFPIIGEDISFVTL